MRLIKRVCKALFHTSRPKTVDEMDNREFSEHIRDQLNFARHSAYLVQRYVLAADKRKDRLKHKPSRKYNEVKLAMEKLKNLVKESRRVIAPALHITLFFRDHADIIVRPEDRDRYLRFCEYTIELSRVILAEALHHYRVIIKKTKVDHSRATLVIFSCGIVIACFL